MRLNLELAVLSCSNTYPVFGLNCHSVSLVDTDGHTHTIGSCSPIPLSPGAKVWVSAMTKMDGLLCTITFTLTDEQTTYTIGVNTYERKSVYHESMSDVDTPGRDGLPFNWRRFGAYWLARSLHCARKVARLLGIQRRTDTTANTPKAGDT